METSYEIPSNKQSTVDREKKVLEIMRIFAEEGDLKTQSVYATFVHDFHYTMKS